MRRPLPTARIRSVAAVFATVLAVSGLTACGSEPSSQSADQPAEEGSSAPATPGAAPAACETVDAPLTAIESRADGEPSLQIPQPPGWERTTEMDSQLIRFAMVNRALATEDFAPNAVVTMESVPGTVPPKDVFESNRKTLTSAGAGTDLDITTSTLCGQPAERVEYTCAAMGQAPARPCRLLSVVTTDDTNTYLVTLTVQTVDPGNPVYQKDGDAILTGLRVASPGDN